jgi:putative membrane-bound dehydrogenase-like protein
LAALGLAWLARGEPAAVTRLPGALPAEAGREAWLVAWLKPAPSFFQRHERDLFGESILLGLRGVAGAHEAWVNGERVGASPHDPARALHRHKIPPGLLRREAWNEIALRLTAPAGGPARLAEAPFVMNYFDECTLAGEWERHPPARTPAGPLTHRPTRAAYDQFHESHRVLGEPAEWVRGARRTPQETLAALRPAPGLVVDLLLHEPEVAQPNHLSYDARGRLWVTQFRQYPYPAGVTPVSRDKYYRTQYDRVPPPPPHHTPGRDRVTLHEDRDGDGRYDTTVVFAEGLNFAVAALSGAGGVWVMHPPYLLFYPDANGDDRPDGPPEVRLRGFGLEDSHSVANGLLWGPDGWLYGMQGSTTSSRVLRPGDDPPGAPGVFFEGCMVWRYHPRTRHYEIFAEGGGNNFGLNLDDAGRLYGGHNGGGTRGWQFLPGAQYVKQEYAAGKIGPPHRPYAYGDLAALHTSDSVRRFTHHLAVVESPALPADWQGKLLGVDPLHGQLTASERIPRGSGWSTRDGTPALESDDPSFRPVFLANAPDGSLHVADFYEHYIAHGQHYQGQLDPDTGRLFRLRGAKESLLPPEDLTRRPSAALVEDLAHPNAWRRFTAVRLLGERRDPAVLPALRDRLRGGEPRAALAAFWALHQMEARTEEDTAAALGDAHPMLRAWAARLLGEDAAVPPALARAWVAQAAREPDPEARALFAAAARRVPPPLALAVIDALARHAGDAEDPQIPHLLWWALEEATARDAAQVIDWAETAAPWSSPLFAQHLGPRLLRRQAEEGRTGDLAACARLLRAAPAAARPLLLAGFEAAFQARALPPLPPELEAALADSGALGLSLRVRRGDPQAAAEAEKRLRDTGTPVAEREQAALALAQLDPSAERLTLAWDILRQERQPEALRVAVLGGLVRAPPAAWAEPLAAAAGAWPTGLRRAALAHLAAHPDGVRALMGAIEAARFPAQAVPEDLRTALREHRDPELARAANARWPAPAATGDAAARVAELAATVRAGSGNPYAGLALYEERCAACHRLFGKGGALGPDLTRYQRDDLEALLRALVDPDAEIREGYQLTRLRQRDGREWMGFITARDAHRLTLRGLDGGETLVEAKEAVALEPVGRSLMPRGLLDDLEETRLRDLFAFLRSAQPIRK